jgi:uncharacterized protein
MNDIPETPSPVPARAFSSPPLSTSDERTWAMLAHLSILLNLVTGVFGPVVPLVIYFVYKDRSRYLAYQSLQAFVFQLLWWIGGGAVIGTTWAITGILSIFIVGLVCIPIAILISFLPIIVLIYGVVAGIRTSQGEDFKYWLIGDWVRGTLIN